jgi:anti-anti-sigma factor
MSGNKILCSRQGEICVIKMCGRLRHTVGDDFDVLIEDRLFDGDRLGEILVDLSELESADSTILGLLAKVARRRLDASENRPTIFSPSESVFRVLSSMGFEAVFDIVHTPVSLSASCEPIPPAGEGARDKGELMLEAHRLLQDMNERNRETFRTVVEILDKEVQQKRNTPA